MKFTANIKKLTAALARVLPACAGKTALPILSNVLLKVDGARLYLTASNLDIGIEDNLLIEHGQDGEITLPGKSLAGLLSRLPGDAVTLDCAPGSDIATVRAAGGGMYRVKGLPGNEFPGVPSLFEASVQQVSASHLCRVLRAVSGAPSDEPHRYALNGVFLSIGAGGQLRAEASNGKILARAETDDFRGALKTTSIPAAVAKILIANDTQGLWDILIDGGRVRISGPGVVTARLIDGEKPDFQQIIPQDSDNHGGVQRAEFLKVLGRVGNISREKVEIKREGAGITLSAESADGEFASDFVHADGFQNFRVAVNPAYLTALLKNIPDDQIEFHMHGPDVPFKILGDGFLGVVMPLREGGK
jgi:DNA polymerase-3 subunit beta